MGKELRIEMYVRDDNRERLRTEDVQLLSDYATLKYEGKEIPPEMLPLAQHISQCSFCQKDVQAFEEAIQREEEAQVEFLLGESERSTPYMIAAREATEITMQTPAEGVTYEERKKINDQVREKLLKTSDLALVWLMRSGHQLSRKELVSRLNEEEITQFQALFEVMIPVPFRRIDYHNDKLFSLAYNLALKQASPVSQSDFIDASLHYFFHGVLRDSDWYEDILSLRPDIEAIIEAVGLQTEQLGRNYSQQLPRIKEAAERKRDSKK